MTDPLGPNDRQRNINLLWPFIAGCLFLLIVLGIAFFGGTPSPQQFTIYRIVIALAGAGFAVALTGELEVNFPVFKTGFIKASTAFAVFVILFFFSPAALVASEPLSAPTATATQ